MKPGCQLSSVPGKLLHLGSFTCKHEAAKARREAELQYFGEFAPLRRQQLLEN